MIRVICVKLFFRSIAPRPSRSPAEKSRSYRLPKTTANPAPNGRPLSQSRWTSSAHRCSTDRTVHGKLEIEFTGPDKLLGKLAPHADKLRTYENNVQRLGRFTAA